MLKMLYFAFVPSHILYGIEVYANTCHSHLSKLCVLNNKILRIIENKPLRTPIFQLYKNFNTLPIPELHQFQLLCVVHKYFNTVIKTGYLLFFQTFFTPNTEIHSYNTRSINNLHLSSINTLSGARCIKSNLANCGIIYLKNLNQVKI